MGWQKDRRLRRGGWWECREQRKAANATRHGNPKVLARRRELFVIRYDSDPIFRIGSNLRTSAAKRAKRLAKRREALLKGEDSDS